MPDPALPPIECAVNVPWPPDEAFRRFVDDFAKWWPHRSHSIGAERLRCVVFEAFPGGRIFEEHLDGRRFQWGCVSALERPHWLRFNFHPARDPSTAQRVEIRFMAADGGTHVLLTATDWEKWGRGASSARQGYRLGWNYLLNEWAGRRTAGMLAINGLALIARALKALRGGTAGGIRRAGGEIERAEVP